MKTYKFKVNSTPYEAKILKEDGDVISLELNGTSYDVTLQREEEKPKEAPKAAPTAVASGSAPAGGGAQGTINSPLPGTITEIFCKVGDAISVGQKVMTLEAMKMENDIESDKAGTVKEIKVNKSDSVMEGDVLIVVG